MGLLTIKCTELGNPLAVKEIPSQIKRYKRIRVRGVEVVCRRCKGCDTRMTCKERGR